MKGSLERALLLLPLLLLNPPEAAPQAGIPPTYNPSGSSFGGARIPTLEAPSDDALAAIGAVAEGALNRAELVAVEKIWAEAPHNAFTDLIRFRERWYCTFREGSAHVSGDGMVRLISSPDGSTWSPSALMGQDGIDLRDPKLSVTPDNRLMLSAAAVYQSPRRYQTLAWYSLDGRDWGTAFQIGDENVWLWRVSWYRGHAYSMGYSTKDPRFLRMYVGPEGLRFQTLADKVLTEDTPTEATLLFSEKDDSAVSLLRRDAGSGTTMMGRSRPPYRGWEWTDLGLRLAAPNMIRLPDRRIVAAGRLYDPEQRTAICWLDEQEGTLSEMLTLPSGGDTSYPGLVFHDDLLWVSYYSSHEGETAIYLAKVRLPKPESEGPIR